MIMMIGTIKDNDRGKIGDFGITTDAGEIPYEIEIKFNLVSVVIC